MTTRTFTFADQLWFADLSGDRNPLHVDPEAARRLLAGEVVVHGMHSVMWALDRCLAAHPRPVGRIAARFHAPVLLERPVALDFDAHDNSGAIARLRRDQTILVSIELAWADSVNLTECPGPSDTPPLPQVRTAEAFGPLSGSETIGADASMMAERFPHLIRWLGLLPSAALLSATRMVGMSCPGEHSLFGGFAAALTPTDARTELSWRVERPPRPPAPLKISIAGGGIQGTVRAFLRPEPVVQTAMAAVARVVSANEFTGQCALVVGGSRGLGELVAKVVVAGGGTAIVTYRDGRSDAERVGAEIATHESNGRLFLRQLDVEDLDALPGFLSSLPVTPTSLYYFATPPISRVGHDEGTERKLQLYRRYYVDSFSAIVNALPNNLSVFYPSTIFVDDASPKLAHYADAKRSGELVCLMLKAAKPERNILVRRLPRLATDQTAGIAGRAAMDPFPTVLQAVRDIQRVAPPGPISLETSSSVAADCLVDDGQIAGS